MRGPTDVILDGLDRVEDEQLRRTSARILLWSVALMFANDAAWLLGLISDSLNIFFTLNLSWLAIVLTAAQTIIQTDIKKTVDGSANGAS